MINISEGKIYTKGTSFRARAEARMREYRTNTLRVPDNGKYGHYLAEKCEQAGYNFLPSLRDEILTAVMERSESKGVNLERTCGNMLSSQAMCFNLFVPLKLDANLLSDLLNAFIGDVSQVTNVQVEYTPSPNIFQDQFRFGGVDCDILIHYRTSQKEKGIVVLETKYVEEAFSGCGYRKPGQKNHCPETTTITEDFGSCRYHARKPQYLYWTRAQEGKIFNLDAIYNQVCPFGGLLWQLWVNLALASALAHEEKASRFTFIVLAPEGNIALSNSGKVYEEFRTLLVNQNHFLVVSLEQVVDYLAARSNASWIREFKDRYLF